MSPPTTVLVVDDSAATVEVLRRNLESHGLRVVSAGDADEARRQLAAEPVSLVITDLKMPGESGIELVRHVCRSRPEVAVVMITGYPSIETAVEAVKSGAEEYLTKPFTDEELLAAVDRALEGVAHRSGAAPGRVERRSEVVTRSPEMTAVIRAIDAAARSIGPVLLVGRPGSGRAACARAIHRAGSRASGPFVVLPCSAGDGGWLRAQLLGGEPPAARGLLERADGGTLLLEDVEWLPAELQVELLRVLQERSVPGAGAKRRRPVDVRVMATAVEDLAGRCAAGLFRRDLALLLGSTTIGTPPLGRRRGDPSLLATERLGRLCERDGRRRVGLAEAAAAVLDRYPWPGGLPELEDAVASALASAPSDTVEPAHLPGRILHDGAGGPVPAPLADVELAHIRHVLEHAGGNKSEAARLLGIDRKTLRDRLRRAGIDEGGEV